jgi:exopolysaccharide biosynthesis protein
MKYNSDRRLSRIAIVKRLPKNRIPVFGLGYDNEHQLVVVCIDGRKPGTSAGATLEEAAYIMSENDIINGFIGSAGGDVVVATNSSRLLNIPSSVNRTVSSVLTIQ